MIFNQILSKRKIVKPCDYGNVVKTLSDNETWTATKDGWLYIRETSDNGYDSELYINGNFVLDMYSSTGDMQDVFLYIQKGSTIELRNFRYANAKFFGCIE